MKKLQKLAIVFTAFVFSFFSCAQITDPVNVNTNETTKFGSKQIFPEHVILAILKQKDCLGRNAIVNLLKETEIIEKYPPVVRCHYCEKLIKTEDIDKQFE